MPYKDKEKLLEYHRQHYQENKEKYLENAKKNYKKNWSRRQKTRNQWTAENKEKMRGYQKKYSVRFKEENPEKIRAYDAVKYAVRKGLIDKPNKCEECNKEFKQKRSIHAHHHAGYDEVNKLNVKWLCAKCHKSKQI